ncbi:MAG: proline dehydrogenase family protein [Armatimonadota bacterium]|nr:proline dehydrogenase family protein [Armatimonadota bacterium]MDR7485513.1 proline dehydrogenase family protein [Armatimonadota bacterium]MDR7533058.1 proline dehydrogenase family protein [Armatimonadota bacterium]MDR7536770.1 proline dehydrogenase family protein [Armatimonadota bacterium]
MLRPVLVALSRSEPARRLVARPFVFRRVARRFVAGETADAALQVVAELNARGLAATLDILGEGTTAEADAQRAAIAYLDLLDAIGTRRLQSHVSVKLSQLGLDLSAELAVRLLAQIVRRAAEVGTFVRVDMEDSRRLPGILRVFDRVWEAGWHTVGVALQAYLYRTPQDVERYIARGVSIRLCKGAYAEPPQIAYPRKADVDRAFAALAERLLIAGRSPALATHDERLIAGARQFAAAHGVPLQAYEFQLLYGIRRDLQDALARAGHRVRVYVPFGTHWYPYVMRRMAERPANLWFVARNLLRP